MATQKEIFWKEFQGTCISKQTFSILYDSAMNRLDQADSIHKRIKTFDELIEPQLVELDDRGRELASAFLIGYLKGHLPSDKIKDIGHELKVFIASNMG